AAGSHATFSFSWEGEEIGGPCRIVRSRLERFSVGTDGLTVYHSGLEFDDLQPATRGRLKSMIGRFIGRALEEQKLNARGAMPEHDVTRMPIFRLGGQLTENGKNKEVAAPSYLPASRLAKEAGYVCYALENNQWRRKRTHDPGQPHDGFTISAREDQVQAELLRAAYESADREGRRMIQLCAQLSLIDGEGISAPRFEP
ncbi:MAG TPA: hypothetical protein VEU30_09840, partial [Thermoanaerobaculia bacterium]|nr:hypothetical protein [Thermoanaerobaculia bacterium]